MKILFHFTFYQPLAPYGTTMSRVPPSLRSHGLMMDPHGGGHKVWYQRHEFYYTYKHILPWDSHGRKNMLYIMMCSRKAQLHIRITFVYHQYKLSSIQRIPFILMDSFIACSCSLWVVSMRFIQAKLFFSQYLKIVKDDNLFNKIF